MTNHIKHTAPDGSTLEPINYREFQLFGVRLKDETDEEFLKRLAKHCKVPVEELSLGTTFELTGSNTQLTS